MTKRLDVGPELDGEVCLTLTGDYLEEFHPSTNIRDAMVALEKWRETGDFCCITIKSDYDFVWDISWVRDGAEGHEEERLEGSYDRLPEAICRAIMEALAE